MLSGLVINTECAAAAALHNTTLLKIIFSPHCATFLPTFATAIDLVLVLISKRLILCICLALWLNALDGWAVGNLDLRSAHVLALVACTAYDKMTLSAVAGGCLLSPHKAKFGQASPKK